ncbi:GGDEF domain-containing protein [Oxalobacteraceae bacterium OTU3CAMAD1]|nr:GGDEF domain-containing protein [Oxalobacteraceae bacterium OTU3CAMAD1]
MLHLETLLLVHLCVTLLTTALVAASANYADSPPELRWWAVGNVCVSAGVVMTLVETLPPLLTSVAGYGIVAFGLALVLRGLRVYGAATLSWPMIAVITGIALLVPCYYTLVEPSRGARLVFSGFYFGVLNLWCAAAIARHGGWRRNGTGTCIGVTGFIALGGALLLRGTRMLLDTDLSDPANALMMGVTALVIPLAQICISFGLIVMVMWRYAERLRRLSTLDTLTGTLNRAGLELQGKRVGLRAQRGGRSLAVVMIDVDHFKAINDSHGHLVGDEVLRHLSALLRLELRPHDVLARFGGEEFVLVLDDLNLPDALRLAERLRAGIEQTVASMGDVTVRFTASLGVACSDQHGYDLIRLISAGDAALYAAKRAGRNCVTAG